MTIYKLFSITNSVCVYGTLLVACLVAVGLVEISHTQLHVSVLMMLSILFALDGKRVEDNEKLHRAAISKEDLNRLAKWLRVSEKPSDPKHGA